MHNHKTFGNVPKMMSPQSTRKPNGFTVDFYESVPILVSTTSPNKARPIPHGISGNLLAHYKRDGIHYCKNSYGNSETGCGETKCRSGHR